MTDRPRLRVWFLHLPDGVAEQVSATVHDTFDGVTSAPAITVFLAELDKRLEMDRQAREQDPGPRAIDDIDDPREIIGRAVEDLLTALRVYARDAGLDPENVLPALDRLNDELSSPKDGS